MATDSLKEVLTEIVDQIEKLTAALAVIESGAKDKRTAFEVAAQNFKQTYNNLREKIDALPD